MTYEQHYSWAKERLKKIENSSQKSKKDVIIRLASRLEKSGMLVDSICANISENLSQEGYVSDRYVREVLDNTKYKRKYDNKVTEDIGTAGSELPQLKEPQKRPEIIEVSNTGKQMPWKPKPKEEDKLARVSDLIGLERAIYDRDETIKELRLRNDELQKQVSSIKGSKDKWQENTNESKVILDLKVELESANSEIEYLREQEKNRSVKVMPTLYAKLKDTIIKAIHEGLPCINIKFQGNEITEIDTLQI